MPVDRNFIMRFFLITAFFILFTSCEEEVNTRKISSYYDETLTSFRVPSSVNTTRINRNKNALPINRAIQNSKIQMDNFFKEQIKERSLKDGMLFVLANSNHRVLYNINFGEMNYGAGAAESLVKPDLPLDSVIPIGEVSSFVSQVLIINLLKEKLINLNMTTGKVLGWKKFKNITLKSLLTHSSGLPGSNPTINCDKDINISLEGCVDIIYEFAKKLDEKFGLLEVDRIFWYGPLHLQIAARLIEKAISKKIKREITWNELYSVYLKTPLRLADESLYYADPLKLKGLANPSPFEGLVISFRDFGILSGYLHELYKNPKDRKLLNLLKIPKDSGFKMVMTPLDRKKKKMSYGMGSWLTCRNNLSCKSKKIVSSFGKYGWYTWHDFENNYYAILGTMKYSDQATQKGRLPAQSLILGDTIRNYIYDSLKKSRRKK